MKVKELLSTPDKWTKGTFARNKNGQPDLPESESAVCWCLHGAINRCYSTTEQSVIWEKLDVFFDDQGYSISSWNDAPERAFTDVQKLVEDLDI